MTQMPVERRSSSGRFTRVWMLAALVVMAAFMYWLAMTAEPSAPRVMEEVDDSGLAAGGAAVVPLDSVVATTALYAGRAVRLEGISVLANMGEQAFWTSGANNEPFLIRIGPSLVAEGFTVASGDMITLEGRVLMMSDSILAAWQQEGVITTEGQRMEAEFATGFVEAVRAVRRPAADAAADSSASAGGEADAGGAGEGAASP